MSSIRLYIGENGKSSNHWKGLIESNLNGSKVELVQGGREQKDLCDYFFYGFEPQDGSVTTIITAVNDSNYFKEKTLFLSLSKDEGFTSHQVKSLVATGKMVELNGGKWFETWDDLAQFINS